MRQTIARLPAMLLLFAAGTASAHPGHDISGLVAGLAHPFQGFDHLLAMLAVGVWAARGGGTRIWWLPAAFLGALVTGSALAMHWHVLLPVEAGISASVLALGLLIAVTRQPPVSISVAIAGLFGLMHGYAHGLELPASAAPMEYAAGFLAATVILHLGGIGVGITLRSRTFARMAGAVIAVSGAYLLVSL